MQKIILISLLFLFIFILGFILGNMHTKNKILKSINHQNQKVLEGVIKTQKQINNSSDAYIYNWLLSKRTRD